MIGPFPIAALQWLLASDRVFVLVYLAAWIVVGAATKWQLSNFDVNGTSSLNKIEKISNAGIALACVGHAYILWREWNSPDTSLEYVRAFFGSLGVAALFFFLKFRFRIVRKAMNY
jgi:hypothetical protein